MMMAETEYSTIFHGLLLRRMETLLERISPAADRIPTDVEIQARHILQYSLSWPNAWPVTRQLLLALAPKMEQAGHRDDWASYLQSGFHLSGTNRDWGAKAALAYHIGYIHQTRARYKQAKKFLQLSADLYSDLGNTEGYAEATNRLAYVARLEGRNDEAAALARLALSHLDGKAFGRQFSYFVLGAVKLDLEEWPAAADYFSKSLAICRLYPDQKRLIALRSGNLGTAYYFWGRFKEAEVRFEEAIMLFGQINDIVHVAVMEMNLGNIYLDEGQPQDALTLYDRAGQVLHMVNDEHHLGLLYLNYGRAYRELEEYALSTQYLLNSAARWNRIGHSYWLAKACYELGVTYQMDQANSMAVAQFNNAAKVLDEGPEDDSYQEIRLLISNALASVEVG
ncbi:MAG: tetratricopeptide repeat protein [Caldilineaceae bacterium]|nr:tetratricopeptide repeat protein [Caldilineaceae bacterium]